MDYTSLVLAQCRDISFKVSEARVMKDRCRQLGQKLTSVEKMVLALQASGSITPQVGGSLQSLYTTLMGADTLLHKCAVNRVVNTGNYKNEFNILDRQLQDSLRILATVPHVSHAPTAGHAPYVNHGPSPSYGPPPSYGQPPSYGLPMNHGPAPRHAPPPCYGLPISHTPYPGHAPNFSHAPNPSYAPYPTIDESMNQYNFSYTYIN